MTREEEIKQASNDFSYDATGGHLYRDLESGFYNVAKWADAHPINPWRKASEKLPEENKPVIIAFKFKGEWIYDKGYYTDGEWQADSLNVLDIVEYWMPITKIKEN